MSFNPPKLSNIWYSTMNGASVPALNKSDILGLKNRYEIFDKNVSNIAPLLSHAVKQGYLDESTVINALSIESPLAQVSTISTLLSNVYWPNLCNSYGQIIQHHKSAIRLLIESSLTEDLNQQQRVLESFDSICLYYDQVVSLSLSMSDSSDFGTENLNQFGVRLLINDAVNTEFDVNQFFDPRLQDVVYQVVEKIMPYQFECSTVYHHEYSAHWYLEEYFTPEQIKQIATYVIDNKCVSWEEIDQQSFCDALELDDPEIISFFDDYGGFNLIVEYHEMDKFSSELTLRSDVKDEKILKNITDLTNKHALLTPLVSVFSYFKDNIGKLVFPFESASDIDTSAQYFYSYNNVAEQPIISEVTETFYAQGESAALKLDTLDPSVELFFSNYAITSCVKCLLIALIELLDSK